MRNRKPHSFLQSSAWRKNMLLIYSYHSILEIYKYTHANIFSKALKWDYLQGGDQQSRGLSLKSAIQLQQMDKYSTSFEKAPKARILIQGPLKNITIKFNNGRIALQKKSDLNFEKEKMATLPRGSLRFVKNGGNVCL